MSDIHVGQTDEEWLWPTFKHALFDDFERLLGKTGPADVLIFSGDLAQFGHAAEFERFTTIFAEVRESLAAFGPVPPLVAVVGNHDLVRPTEGGPLEAAMRQVPEDNGVLRQIFDVRSEYHAMLAKLFSNFTSWQEQMIVAGVHLSPSGRGPMPGDLAFELATGGDRVGIVTLNSAWLQLAAGDYRGRLHIDPRQLNHAANGDPEAWCRSHDINLIVTHHPTDWLHPSSVALWEGEVAPAGRFDLHLFGHMHEHAGQVTTHGGSPTRRAIQASSVFGLDRIDGKQRRTHGYSVGEIGERYGLRQISIWPRTLRALQGGERRIVPDHDQALGEDNSFSWPLPQRRGFAALAPAPAPISIDEASKPNAQTVAIIDKLRYHLHGSRAHLAVRRIEREEGQAALEEHGLLWITHDWGLGEDGFTWCLLLEKGEIRNPVFRLDLQRFVTREQFLSDLRAEIGCSFEQVCEYLATLDGPTILFDNVPVPPMRDPGTLPVERELEELANIAREFASTSRVVLRGRPKTQNVRAPIVELRPFEEADVADYVRAHELGGDGNANPDAVGKMWQYTGGSPVRLEAMLRDLEVTSLNDLLSSAPDYTNDLLDVSAPAALIGTLRELSLSDVPVWERAYQLLEALTALPRGERFERIRRFLGVHPFFPNHARELASRGLIETVQLSGMADEDAGAAAKTLVVPRVVLDAVRQQMLPERRREIDRLAMELYFGANWQAGDIAKSSAGKRCADPLCEPYEVLNACALIDNAVVQAREDQDDIKVEAAIRLASAFVEVLRNGDHFRAAAQLCERIIPLVEIEGNEQRIDILRYALARSARMINEREWALETVDAIDRDHLSKSQCRMLNLELALIYAETDDDLEAAKWARAVLKGGKSDGLGLQARSILVQQLIDPTERLAELATLEQRARKIKASVVANNIAMKRATFEKGDPALAAEHLDRVVASAEAEGDFYNGTKAIIRLMRLRQKGGEALSTDHVNRLIRAYQHLHNERGGNLFDQSHDALWATFASSSERENMLRLFRHSSLIWRLCGEEEREDPFIEQISRFVSEASVMPGLSRELAYYRSRAAASVERRTALGPALLSPMSDVLDGEEDS
ncbi:MAG: metallophosphoesterase [Devosia sp.]